MAKTKQDRKKETDGSGKEIKDSKSKEGFKEEKVEDLGIRWNWKKVEYYIAENE